MPFAGAPGPNRQKTPKKNIKKKTSKESQKQVETDGKILYKSMRCCAALDNVENNIFRNEIQENYTKFAM